MKLQQEKNYLSTLMLQLQNKMQKKNPNIHQFNVGYDAMINRK